MKCRHCHISLSHIFLDLGGAPPSNYYLSSEQLYTAETYLPLRLYVCHICWLVQTADYAQASDLFSSDYAYYSSTSKTWLTHAKQYAESITERLELNGNSLVVEIASNDGYLLKNFVAAKIPCIGVEPTEGTAHQAELLGIPVIKEFFGAETAKKLITNQGRCADLVCANNVYAHVPDINDFTIGLKICLAETGTVTLEFPHILQLLLNNQFDTVYHEHFSYLSLIAVNTIFKKFGLKIYDVEELSTHGGSVRVYGCHEDDSKLVSKSVLDLMQRELDYGLNSLSAYRDFQLKANRIKNDFLYFLIHQRKMGKTIAAYGAAAKGNTLINYAGVKQDLIDFVCDAATSKQGKFLPGSHIPILDPEAIFQIKPDFVLILPWNISSEIMEQLQDIRTWGGKFFIALPEIKVFE